MTSPIKLTSGEVKRLERNLQKASGKVEAVKEIVVNLDERCKRCRKKGTVNKSGICMDCITKAIMRGDFDHIIKKSKAKQSK